MKQLIKQGHDFALGGISFTAERTGVVDMDGPEWPAEVAHILGCYVCDLPSTVKQFLPENIVKQSAKHKKATEAKARILYRVQQELHAQQKTTLAQEEPQDTVLSTLSAEISRL